MHLVQVSYGKDGYPLERGASAEIEILPIATQVRPAILRQDQIPRSVGCRTERLAVQTVIYRPRAKLARRALINIDALVHINVAIVGGDTLYQRVGIAAWKIYLDAAAGAADSKKATVPGSIEDRRGREPNLGLPSTSIRAHCYQAATGQHHRCYSATGCHSR